MIVKGVRESMAAAILNARGSNKRRDGTTGSIASMGTNNAFRIAIGKGKKTLSEDATWLGEPIEDGYKIISSANSSNSSGEEIWSAMTVIENTGSEKITINEMCVYYDYYNSNIRDLPTEKSQMLIHEVLDKTIEVLPGEKCALSMNLVWPKD